MLSSSLRACIVAASLLTLATALVTSCESGPSCSEFLTCDACAGRGGEVSGTPTNCAWLTSTDGTGYCDADWYYVGGPIASIANTPSECTGGGGSGCGAGCATGARCIDWGATGAACGASCSSAAECGSGCCAPMTDGTHACAPSSSFCAGSCGACAAGENCVDWTGVGPRCSASCSSSPSCGSGCCGRVSDGSMACAPSSSFCSGSCTCPDGSACHADGTCGGPVGTGCTDLRGCVSVTIRDPRSSDPSCGRAGDKVFDIQNHCSQEAFVCTDGVGSSGGCSPIPPGGADTIAQCSDGAVCWGAFPTAALGCPYCRL